MEHIKAEDCVEGGLYRIWSRNLRFGVYKAEHRGFIGIREKFDHLYLFQEFHWDNGPPFGTVKPKELLEMCPILPLEEGHFDKVDGKDVYVEQDELFQWLTQKEQQYAEVPVSTDSQGKLPESGSAGKVEGS